MTQKNLGVFAGLITPWALGVCLPVMDEFERQLMCRNCGEKRIDS